MSHSVYILDDQIDEICFSVLEVEHQFNMYFELKNNSLHLFGYISLEGVSKDCLLLAVFFGTVYSKTLVCYFSSQNECFLEVSKIN